MKTLTKIKITLLLTWLIWLIALSAYSQDKRFTLHTFTDPNATIKDGFNIGLGIEYQMTIMYFKAQTFYFPGLNGKGYLDYEGTVLGFNLHSKFDDYRLFTGFKAGFIHRDNVTFPKVGLEAGFDYYFRDFYIGIQLSRDYRSDGKIWNVKNYWRNNGFLKIGIEL